MVVEFDPTALARPPRRYRRWFPSPRSFAIGLMATGVALLIGLGAYIAFHPRLRTMPARWSVRLRAGVEADPVLVNGLLLIGSMDGTLWALDATTGQRVYRRAPAALGIGGGIVEHEGLVYFGSDDHGVYAVEPATGDTVSVGYTNGPVRASPVIVGDRVVVGSDDGYLWVFRVGSLERIAEPFPAGSPIAGDLCVYQDRVVFCPLAGGVYVFDPATMKYEYVDVPGPICSCPIVTAGGTVWVGNDQGDIYAVDIETLAIEYVVQISQPVRGAFVEGEGNVYVGGNDGFLYVLRAHRPGLLNRVPSGAPVRARPTCESGMVYWASDDGVIHAATASGIPVAQAHIGDARIGSRPTLAPSGMLYVCDAKGLVRALGVAGPRSSGA